jgi:hypothetical protein
MEIPFDGIITLLIFLVGVPALALQLISPTERRAAIVEVGSDVRIFLKNALLILVVGLVLQFIVAVSLRELEDYQINILHQIIWLMIFAPSIYLVLRVALRVPEYYNRRIEKLTTDAAEETLQKMRVGGRIFGELAYLGKKCDPGREREIVVNALRKIVAEVLVDPSYSGDTFEILINELEHILADNADPRDLSNFDIAIKILIAILSVPQITFDIDRQRAIHAISKLGQTLIVHFKSVERDNIILDYIDSLELALLKREMLSEISQALFEIGVCAVRENHDFIFVAVLDKMTTFAGRYSPLPGEFVTDLLGLISHYWTGEGCRKKFAQVKFNQVKEFLQNPILRTLGNSRKHLISTMYFDEADKLAQMAEDIRREEEKRKKRKGKPRRKK